MYNETGYDIVGIDLGTITGLTVWEMNTKPLIAHIDLKPDKDETHRAASIFAKFGGNIQDLLSRLDNPLIAYERVLRWSSSRAAYRYCGLFATLQLQMAMHDVSECRLIPVSPKTVKYSFTGNGNSNKVGMVNELNRRLKGDGINSLKGANLSRHPVTEDMADSMAVADWLHQQIISKELPL